MAGLADHGHRLPAAERLAWRNLARRLQDLADDDGGYQVAKDAPANYAEQVRALHDQLATTDTPPTPLAARWVAGWLAEHDDPAAPRAQPQVLVIAPAVELAGQPQPPGAGDRRWDTPAPPGDRHRPGIPPRRGWAVLLVSDVTVTTAPDYGCLTTIGGAAELTRAADDRPWQFRQVSSQVKIHIGPSQTREYSSADKLAADLAHLALGLNLGQWRVGTLAGPGNRTRP